MNKIKIKTESLNRRCEICHQVDTYDPIKNYCKRCGDIEVVNGKVINKASNYSNLLIVSILSIVIGTLTLSVFMYGPVNFQFDNEYNHKFSSFTIMVNILMAVYIIKSKLLLFISKAVLFLVSIISSYIGFCLVFIGKGINGYINGYALLFSFLLWLFVWVPITLIEGNEK